MFRIFIRGLLAGLWLGTCALAFWLGREVMPAASAPEVVAPQTRPSAPVVEVPRSMPAPVAAAAPAPSVLSVPAGPRGPSPLERLLGAAFSQTDADPEGRLAGLAAGLGVEEVRAGLARLAAMPADPRTRRLEFALVDQWAKLDPLRAMEYARGVTEPMVRQELKQSALRSWAEKEPLQAMVYAEMNPEGDLGGNRMDLIFEGAKRAAPADALLFLGRIDPEKFAGRIQDAVWNLYGRAPDEVVRWTEQLPPGRLRDDAVDRVIDHWARYDPVACQAWMNTQITDEFRLRANVELGESWARVNPQQAQQWFDGLPDDQRQPAIRDRIFSRWIEYEPATALQWLDGQAPAKEKDVLYEMAARRSGREQPQTAIAWAERMSDPARRDRSIEHMARHWGERDPAAMGQYIAGSNLGPDGKKRLLEYAGKRIADQKARP